MSTAETWLPVVGAEGFYEVSDLGGVRRVTRLVGGGKGGSLRTWKGRQLSPTPDNHGYLRVVLSVNGRRKHRRVHTLVAEAHIGLRPSPHHEVLHGPLGKLDNGRHNLRWGTRSENNFDAIADGTHYQARKTRCDKGHEFDEQNTRIRKGTRWRACRACHRERRAS
jgi:hypothetical protein